MRDAIRDLIVDRITDGRYPPGTRLKELALAGEFNTSQAPVREALRELEALGLVQSERYRGTRVREVDADELSQAYELRSLLEERAAQLAVPCDEAVLTGLAEQVARMRQAFRRRDAVGHTEAAIAFHRAIVAASGNRVFLSAWDNLHWEVRTRIAVQRVRAAGLDLAEYIEAHDAILEALRAADGERAGQLIRDLIRRLMSELGRDRSVSAPAARGARSRGARPAPAGRAR
jgi:DNA-binding GntR family transcriptional regulator